MSRFHRLVYFGGISATPPTKSDYVTKIEDQLLSSTDPNPVFNSSLQSKLTDAAGLYKGGSCFIFGGAESPYSIMSFYFKDDKLEERLVKVRLPNPRVCSVALSSGNRYIYLIGGSLSGNTMDRLDIETMEFVSLAPMKFAREKFDGVVFSEEGVRNIIVVGGRDPNTGQVHDSMEIYDTMFNIWYTMPTKLSIPKFHIHARLNTRFNLVVVGGINEDNRLVDDIEVLRLSMDKDEVLPSEMLKMPGGILFGSSVSDNKSGIWYFSGGVKNGEISDIVLELDLHTFALRKLESMETPRNRHVVMLFKKSSK